MNIRPVNNHILIEPLKHESFIPTDKGTYEEIGVVLAVPEHNNANSEYNGLLIGKRVYFDSWLAGKFPTGKGSEYFWLVSWSDIKAIEVDG